MVRGATAEPRLGEFIVEIERCVTSASAQPERHPVVHHDLRRAVARRFPYCMYFGEEAGRIVVLAVFHASRDPSIWQRRD